MTNAEHDDVETGQRGEFAEKCECRVRTGVEGRRDQSGDHDSGGGEGYAGKPVTSGGLEGGTHFVISGMTVT